jgi:hypothetical protein
MMISCQCALSCVIAMQRPSCTHQKNRWQDTATKSKSLYWIAMTEIAVGETRTAEQAIAPQARRSSPLPKTGCRKRCTRRCAHLTANSNTAGTNRSNYARKPTNMTCPTSRMAWFTQTPLSFNCAVHQCVVHAPTEKKRRQTSGTVASGASAAQQCPDRRSLFVQYLPA